MRLWLNRRDEETEANKNTSQNVYYHYTFDILNTVDIQNLFRVGARDR